MHQLKYGLGMLMIILFCLPAMGQEKSKSKINARTVSGMAFRGIGPAFASGRIADIAIHPDDDNMWYVAVGSGGVWKTKNAGVTWQPIFDRQSSYSIGCVTIDPLNPHTIWVGTGENVGGRHVGFGDGLYKSEDDGKTWKNVGLKASEHISEIIVHPENSDVVWVASQGPLWSSGGERGLYKTTDGGKNWALVLSGNEWTGVTDIALDPRDPDVIYAATWQRHRTVAAYMGGGPGSGIHRSTDGGTNWREMKTGLPGSNMGKIGIAIDPFNPDMLYAAIELDRRKGGVYMSDNRGMSWKKMSNAVAGATGPHYYQELYTSPHQKGRLYLVDNRIQVSDDYGKTFKRLTEKGKHSDNHAIVFREDDPDYLLIGTDGGLYESFDLAKNWRFIDNMPITQYYKVAVDDAEPFYFVYGGTQDNGSHGGPSRTDNVHGIRNADWFKTLGADGHQSATEPGNPNIMYAETQQGGLHRVDRITGDQVAIQPQPGEGEDFERYNWDAPIVVSPHKPSRLYFASQRVWKSDDRGDSWTAISGDLTRDEERITLPIMGKQQSWDNPWDMYAMSNYNTITSLSESPAKAGLLYAGTDDGIVQMSEDDGQNWNKVMLSDIKDMPERLFVNDIRADLFDENVVYMCADNHKEGDYKPYLMKSSNKGKSWESISGNLPDRMLVWRLVQDHVNPNLMFLAAEYGIYFTVDGGKVWTQLKGGLPTISFRDITIQRRENDVVAASFGRGFYILDDYTPLRTLTEEAMAQEAILFQPRKAYWYSPKSVVSSQGGAKYVAKNPKFGANFTYYLKEGLTTAMADRKKNERKMKDQDVPFPGWEALEAEKNQEKPKVQLVIKDMEGNVVRRVKGRTSAGMHRINWDLRYDGKNMERLEASRSRRSWGGYPVTPGKYTATLTKVVDGKVSQLGEPVEVEVVPLRKGALEGASYDEMIAFRKDLQSFQEDLSSSAYMLKESMNKVKAMQRALNRSDREAPELVATLHDAKMQLMAMDMRLNGNSIKGEVGEKTPPTPRSRMYMGYRALTTTYGPTKMHKEMVALGQKELAGIQEEMEAMIKDLMPKLEEAMQDAGAPMIEGIGSE
ncbi:MAG: glycosyl hydrolase [Bacteroidota bacterium]